MRLLLDECIDRRLAREIEGHGVVTVPQAGWEGIRNGELLRLAQEQFDVFITVDRNLSFQQHLPRFTMIYHRDHYSACSHKPPKGPPAVVAATSPNVDCSSGEASDVGEPIEESPGTTPPVTRPMHTK